jgi:REP element-mobilizing transposase RayT
VFSIDVCAYAVMSNHCHLVLNINVDSTTESTADDVLNWWCRLYRGPEGVQRYRAGGCLTKTEQESVSTIVSIWRERLSNLSWFMRCLNEHIARRANAEDRCTGRFWEGRFKSQALLDETALVTAMAYVDLNPIRAGIATDLANSDKTCIKQRLEEVAQQTTDEPVIALMPFSETGCPPHIGLPFNFQDYLDLVDWTGRSVRDVIPGAIDSRAPRLLSRMGIANDEGLPTVTETQSRFESVMGSPAKMKAHAESRGRFFYRGYRHALRLYQRLAA